MPDQLPRRPLAFVPQLVARVWGGDALKSRARWPQEAPAEPVGESWEISDEDGALTLTTEGWSLRELMRAHREALVGAAFEPTHPDRFPLLLKLIDAQQDLSVQVHPDDDHAARQRPGALGKTECWYVLDAAPGALIYRGLESGTTPERLAAAARAGDMSGVLHRFTPRPGDAVFVPAGTLHAIGAGVRLVEIQQTSDITYRVYDWNRVGMDGRPRELHLDRALEVIDWDASSPGAAGDTCAPQPLDEPAGCRARLLLEDPKLRVRELSSLGAGDVTLNTNGDRFHIVTVVAGSVRVDGPAGGLDRGPCDSALLPAAVERYRLRASGDATVLLFDRP